MARGSEFTDDGQMRPVGGWTDDDLLLMVLFDAAGATAHKLFPYQFTVHPTVPTLRLGTSYE